MMRSCGFVDLNFVGNIFMGGATKNPSRSMLFGRIMANIEWFAMFSAL